MLSPYTTSYSTGRQQNSSSEIQIANLQSLISIHVQLPKIPLSHRTNCCKLIKEQLRDVSQQREMWCDETHFFSLKILTFLSKVRDSCLQNS